ncbi:PspC domain-containing protein [Candidatus Parcubacteria bacterium]|nr:MAG: PspC domain-containing protein [Candidatus Parcubacteria bacterium]
MKRLYRSEENQIIAGVVGGIGEYFDVDPTLLRLVWLLIVIFTGFFPGILAYLLAVLVIPRRPAGHRREEPRPQPTA